MVSLLNGKDMTSYEVVHSYLKEKLALPDYYGGNLDALWDALIERTEPTTIIFLEIGEALYYLGDYGMQLLMLFQELAEENEAITLLYRIPG